MEKIYIKARAKINLSLEILEKRIDKYHNLKSVFQKVNLYDELWIEKTDNNEVEIQTNAINLSVEENIIYKAYIKLKEQYETISGVKVILKKKIPMQAGMAGGSTDCASFLIGMNRLFELNLSKEKIEEIGKNLGADVVPCMYNKALLAEGIGEIVTPIKTNFKYYMIIIKPEISFSTKEMFEKLDKREKINQKENARNIIKALEKNQLNELAGNLYNVFEEVIEEKHEIQKIKQELKANGAIESLMTGSGSCVFGIFKDKEKAKEAYQKLKRRYETYICTSYNSLKEQRI